jgi:uncharacterized cupredoxin-like copper-binding protein
MKWAVALALGLLCSLLLVPGCGGDDEKDTGATAPAGETTTPGGSAPKTVTVTETDFEIAPANPTVKAGTVNFKVTNKGKVEHNLEVEAPGGEVELAQNLQPGESRTLEVNLDKAGSYEWYCPVGNHRDVGMEGEVRVTGGGGTNKSGTTTETQTTETQTTETNEDSSGKSGSGSGESGSGGGGSGSGGSGY